MQTNTEQSIDGTINQAEFSDEDITKMWPQAKGELLGFAQHLASRQMNITADQLRMAIQLADDKYKSMIAR